MLILIEKEPASRVPKEVTEAEADDFASKFTVFVINEDGSNTEYSAWKAAQEVPAVEESPKDDAE